MQQERFEGYLDIHSHIIPGVDDGSCNMDMTMEMLVKAYDEGIRWMCATPHFYPGHRNAGVDKLQEIFTEVCRLAADRFPDMKLMLGNEIYYKDEVMELLGKNEIHTLHGSRYVLVEFHVASEYDKLVRAVKGLTMKGYYPILAHIERYACLYHEEDRIEELIRMGAYMQVNAETLLGGSFDKVGRYCHKLIRSGKIHFLGSDCHNTDTRRPVMATAVAVLKKKTPPDLLEKLLVENPQRFLEGIYI